MSSSPTLILKEGTTHVKKGIIQKNNMTAAIITAEMVRSTLGPRGLDKMLTAIRWTDDNLRKIERVTITNDGSTILKDADFKHPISKLLVEAAKAQDSEVGDGTTSVVVFIGELIKKAQKLIEKGVHFKSPLKKIEFGAHFEWKYAYISEPDNLCVPIVEY